MKTALRYALLLTFLSIFCLDADAARKRPRKRAKKNAAEAVAPDTVYIIKYVQPVDTAEVPQRPKFGERGCTDYSPEVRDSLLSGWYRRNVVASYDDFFDRYVSEDTTANGSDDATPDSVYARRLQQLVSPVQLPYNPIVRGYIARYTNPRYGTISRILGLSQYYFPLIEEELIKAGLPVDCGRCRSSNRRSTRRPCRAWAPQACGNSCLRRENSTDWKSTRSSTNATIPCWRPAPPAATLKTCTPSSATGCWRSPPTTAGRGTSTRLSPVRAAARPSGRSTTTCRVKRAAMSLPSSAPPTPTPTTSSTASN